MVCQIYSLFNDCKSFTACIWQDTVEHTVLNCCERALSGQSEPQIRSYKSKNRSEKATAFFFFLSFKNISFFKVITKSTFFGVLAFH